VGLFSFKKKSETTVSQVSKDSMPALPDLPDELKNPSGLEEPPRPSYTSELPLPPVPSFDGMDLPPAPTPSGVSAPVVSEVEKLPEAPKNVQTNNFDLSSLDLDDINLDDLNLDDINLDSNVKTSVAKKSDSEKINGVTNENKSVLDETAIPEIGSVAKSTSSKSSSPSSKNSNGVSNSAVSPVATESAIYIKIVNFKKALDVVSSAKDEIDVAVENGNLLLSTSTSHMKSEMDKFQANLQQVKSKLYKIESIIYD
jgi:hypothetical protein